MPILYRALATFFAAIKIRSQRTLTDNIDNGIEEFWNQSKRTLRKYNGFDKKHFLLFLKDCEFRFNYGLPSNQLKTLRKWCDI